MAKIPESFYEELKGEFGIHALMVQASEDNAGGIVWMFDNSISIQGHKLPSVIKSVGKQERDDIISALKTYDYLRDILVIYIVNEYEQHFAKIDVIDVINEV